MDDTTALNLICDALSEEIWDADTIEEIANIVIMSGRTIIDPLEKGE